MTVLYQLMLLDILKISFILKSSGRRKGLTLIAKIEAHKTITIYYAWLEYDHDGVHTV